MDMEKKTLNFILVTLAFFLAGCAGTPDSTSDSESGGNFTFAKMIPPFLTLVKTTL
jgi:starvation-inducible outer membrane lipoprotein